MWRAGRPAGGRDPPQLLGEARRLPRRLPCTRLADSRLPAARARAAARAARGDRRSSRPRRRRRPDRCRRLRRGDIRAVARAHGGIVRRARRARGRRSHPRRDARASRARGRPGFARHRRHAQAARLGGEGRRGGAAVRPVARKHRLCRQVRGRQPAPAAGGAGAISRGGSRYRADQELAWRVVGVARPDGRGAYEKRLARGRVGQTAATAHRLHRDRTTTTRRGRPCTRARRRACARRSATESSGSSTRIDDRGGGDRRHDRVSAARSERRRGLRQRAGPHCGRRAQAAHGANRDRRLRPRLARPVRAGGGAYPLGARREGRATRARGLDIRADPPRQADHRHRARGPGFRRRAGVRARSRSRRLRSSHPGARVVRAPNVQRAGHECESPRAISERAGDRSHAPVP